MYYTHHFSNHETLSRARTWLSRLGFGPESIETHTDGIPRIAMAIEPAEWPGVEMLLHAVERSDPQGSPGLWDVAAQAHVYPEPGQDWALAEPAGPRSTVIGWHPPDAPTAVDAGQDAFRQAMKERWG